MDILRGTSGCQATGWLRVTVQALVTLSVVAEVAMIKLNAVALNTRSKTRAMTDIVFVFCFGFVESLSSGVSRRVRCEYIWTRPETPLVRFILLGIFGFF